MAEDIACGDIDLVGIDGFDFVDIGLDALHLVEIFHGPLFARGDNEPLFSYSQRDLGLAWLKLSRFWQLGDLVRSWRQLNLNQRFHLCFEYGGRAVSTTAARTVRFNGRKTCLDMLKGWQARYDFSYVFHRGGAVFCDSM